MESVFPKDLPPFLELRPSGIEGYGIYTTINLSANQFLGYFVGTEMSLREFKEKYGKDVRYCYQLGRLNRIIVSKEQRTWATFLNENKVPNCCLKKRGCWTLYDIAAGTELTLLYDKKGVIKYPRDYTL